MSKVILLIGLVIFLAGCSAKETPPRANKSESPQPSSQADNSPPSGTLDQNAAAADNSKLHLESIAADDPLVDLLAKCKPEHVVRGKAHWERSAEGGSELVLDQPQQGSQVVIPVHPPAHYEMSLRLTLLEGDETFFWGIRAGDRQGMLSLDAFPRGGYATGVGAIGNKRPGDKDFWPRIRGRLLKKGQTVELRCLATPDDICIAMDGKRLLHVPAESVHELRMADFFTPPSSQCLFVGTWNARYRVEAFMLEPLLPQAATDRLQAMLAGEKLRTALIVNWLPPHMFNALQGELRSALAEYRILERKDQGAKKAALAAAGSLYQPGFLQQRRMLARSEAADLVIILDEVKGPSPHNRLFVFGADGTLAANYLLPYTGNMQLDQALSHRAAVAAQEKVRQQAMLLTLGSWTAQPTATDWSDPARELVLAAISLSPWCQFYGLGELAATSEFGPRESWQINGQLTGDAQRAVVQLELRSSPQAAPLTRTVEISDTETGGGQELASAVESLLAEAAGADATSNPGRPIPAADFSPLPKNNRSPLALLLCGQAAPYFADGDFLAAADCFTAAALAEPDREVYHAKAAWCCAKISGLPKDRAAAYLRGLRHLRLAEQTSKTPERLRGEGNFVSDIPELLMKSGRDALADLDNENRVALQNQQARLLLQLVARRLDADAAADLYLEHLKDTTPSDQREVIWQPLLDDLGQQTPALADAIAPLMEPSSAPEQAAAPAADELSKTRTWTLRDGRVAKLTFVKRTESGVRLMAGKGRIVDIAWEQLSDKDQQWVNQQENQP